MRTYILLLAIVTCAMPPAALATDPPGTDAGGTWASSPRAFLTAWRIAPLSKSVVAAGETRFLSTTVPADNRPEDLEALLPGSRPQLARFPAMILRKGQWSSLSFTGSSDTFAGLIDESVAPPVLHLRASVDGKELPEVTVPLQLDLSGAGIVVVGAPDGTNYALGAQVVLFSKDGL